MSNAPHHDDVERPREEHAGAATTMVDPPTSGRHPVNVGHLVMGVAFLGLTLVWALLASDTVELGPSTGWIMGLPWLVAGAIGLLATALRGRRT